VTIARERKRAEAAIRTPEDLLALFPDPVRHLTERLRMLVRATLPTATEHVYPGWRALGYRDEHGGYFCGLFPQSDHVRLLFEHGAALPDPARQLEGTTKQVRYVAIRTSRDIRVRPLRQLLRAAALHGSI
jgi:hypothetical protein